MMTKRIIGIALALCLLLTAVWVPAAEGAGGAIRIYSTEDFYAAFPVENGVVQVPSNMMVTVSAEELQVDESISVGENSMFVLLDDCVMTVGGDIENNAMFNVCKGAVLTVGGRLINNNSFSTMEKSLFFPAGGLVNNYSVQLDGVYGCAVIGAHDGEPQELTYVPGFNTKNPGMGTTIYCAHGSVILMNADDEHPADLGAAADDLRALSNADAQGGQRGFLNAVIYGWARDLGEMIAFNEDDRLDGIYVEGRRDRELIPIGEDLTINKKLAVGPCDLVLQHGKTLTVSDPQENLLFRENGRIVCEAQGAAYPDAPAGGTLMLGGEPVFSGDPAAAPVNPTQDIIWLDSSGDENGRYPAAGDCIHVGDMSGAELHGGNDSLDHLSMVMNGRDSRIRLTDDFRCGKILLNGEAELNGKTLEAERIYYTNDSRVNADGGEVVGTAYFETCVDTGFYGFYRDFGQPAGTEVYPALDLGVPSEDVADDASFKGWHFASGWDIPGEQTAVLELVKNTDNESERYGEYYFVMPAYPVILRADWDTCRVELTKYDTTVCFDGAVGHEYSMAYLDSVKSTDEEIAAFGVDREFVSAIVAEAADMAGGDVLNLISLWLYDGDKEIDTPFEMRIKLPEGAEGYDSLQLRIVHIDGGNEVHVDPATIPCRVEDGVMIAELDRNESAFILVGAEEQEMNRVELEFERPAQGSSTDTPHTPDGSDWERHRQTNKPRVRILNGPGAYVQGTLWIVPGEGDVPYIGAFEDGGTYTFTTVVNVEPGYYFADDIEIVFRGAKYLGHTKHIMDENGRADILFITAELEPPTAAILLGDTDGDQDVTILDATYIQRELAKLSNPAFIREASDVDGDGDMTILDTTAIQRWLAGIDKIYPIGEPING